MRTIDNRTRTVLLCAWAETINRYEHVAMPAFIGAARAAFSDVDPVVIMGFFNALITKGVFAICDCGAIVAGPRFGEAKAFYESKLLGASRPPPGEPEVPEGVTLAPDGFVMRPGKA